MPSELEKMIAGQVYNPGDPELVAARQAARGKTRIYNSTTELENEKRKVLLKELFKSGGDQAFVEPPFHCDYGFNISVGKNFYMNFNCVILDCAEVEIGDDVFCGPAVHIYTATHPVDAQLRTSGVESAKRVSIDHRVWIGGGAIICPGVTIGADTTIGAGSLVTKDIPSGVLAAGNPCRVIRKL